jgi:hypothetical protein
MNERPSVSGSSLDVVVPCYQYGAFLRSGLEFSAIENAATQLEGAGLLTPIQSPTQCLSPQEPSAANSDRDPISPRLATAT